MRRYALNSQGQAHSLIALPLAATGIEDAAALATHIGAGQVDALLKWNAGTQTFRFFAPPAGGDNFAVAPGNAIFALIAAGGPTDVLFAGDVVNTRHELQPGGYNFVSLPPRKSHLTTASAVAVAKQHSAPQYTAADCTALMGWASVSTSSVGNRRRPDGTSVVPN